MVSSGREVVASSDIIVSDIIIVEKVPTMDAVRTVAQADKLFLFIYCCYCLFYCLLLLESKNTS